MSRLVNRLAARLKAEMGIEFDPERYEVRRTYAGRHQKSAGAWAWVLQEIDGYHILFGGWEALSTLLTCDKLDIYHSPVTGDRTLMAADDSDIDSI